MQFDCCVGIFHGTTMPCFLVVMTTVEVAPYFRLFLFIAMLNTDGSLHNLKKDEIFQFVVYHNFL
jgi:hypothetical protein